MNNHVTNLARGAFASGILVLTAYVARGQSASSTPQVSEVAVTTRAKALQPSTSCGEAFVEHDLEHTTKARGGEVRFYDSNGSGLAIGDLNNDGLLDIVLGNLRDPVSVLWNGGDFKFRKDTLTNALGVPESQTRAVEMVDVNADGWLDIAFTHTTGGISVWLNDHRGHFSQESLAVVSTPAYAMLWDDLDGDGDLDLVTASYDAVLEAELKDSFLFSSGGGVVVYENTGKNFTAHRLSKNAQTLALAMYDVNGDGRRDLIVGNDFEVPDKVWLNQKDGWQEATPFKRITKNTMSYAVTDMNNDGDLELFATDMKPNFNDPRSLAAWMPLMQKTYERLKYSSIQRAENTLQRRTRDGGFQNIAYDLGIDASGWSWSGQFGDLNNDGFEDLYVVNGMIAKDVFKHLKNFELIENNKAFQNNTRGGFAPAPDWGLGSSASGRGMGMADLNNDGRLDIVVNNLSTPAQLFENRFCGGQAVEVELEWAGTQNLNALGATVKLHLGTTVMQRQVMSQSGYLSGTSPRVHFGVPKDATPDSLEVIWPDGAHSKIDHPQARAILKITRDGSKP